MKTRHHTAKHRKNVQYLLILVFVLFFTSILVGLFAGLTKPVSVLGLSTEEGNPGNKNSANQKANEETPVPTEVPQDIQMPTAEPLPTTIPTEIPAPTPLPTVVRIQPTVRVSENMGSLPTQPPQPQQQTIIIWNYIIQPIMSFPSNLFNQQQPQLKQSSSESPEHAQRVQSLPQNTIVICSGPDGKQSQKTLKDCRDFNRAWSNYNFDFSPTNQTQSNQNRPLIAPTPFPAHVPTIRITDEVGDEAAPDAIAVQTSDDKTIALSPSTTMITLTFKDDVPVVIARKPNGKSTDLDPEVLTTLNTLFSGENIELSFRKNKVLLSEKNEFFVESIYPLIVDLNKKSFSYETEDGVIPMTLFPNQAVQSVQSKKNMTVPANRVISLIPSHHTLAYKIVGTATELFGNLIKIPIERTELVSLETGEILDESDSLINPIIHSILNK